MTGESARGATLPAVGSHTFVMLTFRWSAPPPKHIFEVVRGFLMVSLILRLTVLLLAFSGGVAVSQLLTGNRTVSQSVVPNASPVIVPVVETAILPIPSIPESTTTKLVILDFDPTEFVPDGSYVILGKKPKEFDDLQYLYIETYEGKEGYRTGEVFVGSKDSDGDYGQQSAVFVLIRDKRLILVTEPNATGIEYRFEGEFLRGKVDAGEGKAVISCRLTKTQNGRRIVVRVVKFQIEPQGC